MVEDEGTVDQMKWDSLHEEILTMSISAAFMFGRIYEVGVGDDKRWAFRQGVKDELQYLGRAYRDIASEEDHEKAIVELSKRLSSRFRGCLRTGRFRIGTSQKALNLYLKNLWCHGRIPTPPHCPLDSRIIGLLPPRARETFVKLDDIEVYRNWVAEAKTKAGTKSLAEWDLSEFENTRI